MTPRLGIVPLLTPTGGEYQYSITMLETLVHSGEWNDRGTVFATEPDHAVLNAARKAGWRIEPLDASESKMRSRRVLARMPFRHLLWDARRWIELRRHRHSSPDRIRENRPLARYLRTSGVDFMVYPFPNAMSFETGLPYVMAIHDLQHRLQPEFPEVSAGGEWERREYLYRNAVRRATTLIADSEVGREDILSCYGEVGAVPDRIEVLPFLPAPYLAREPTQEERLEVRRRYRLPERYLYYPAQFWPHKNHLRIVEALSRLQPLQVHVVLSGTATDRLRRRTLATAMEAATRLGVERQIHYLGYVADAEMSSLYAESSGLVFPTFFGPTNIPILEAWATGRPVLTSDIRGVREQVGDAAVLADPRSVDAIGEGMRQLWQDPALCAGLVEKGRVRLSRYTREDYSRRLLAILREALDRASLRGMGTACSV